MRIEISTKKRAATAAAALAVIALAACGGQGGAAGSGTSGVASLPSSAGQSSSAAQPVAGSQGGPAADIGVTVPDNATPAQRDRIYNGYAACLETHGMPTRDFYRKQDAAGGFLVTPDTGQFPAAAKACQSLQPHVPWQEDPRYNPNWARDNARWVNCMNAKGVPVKATPDGWTFNGTSSLSPAQQGTVQVACEMQAFNEN